MDKPSDGHGKKSAEIIRIAEPFRTSSSSRKRFGRSRTGFEHYPPEYKRRVLELFYAYKESKTFTWPKLISEMDEVLSPKKIEIDHDLVNKNRLEDPRRGKSSMSDATFWFVDNFVQVLDMDGQLDEIRRSRAESEEEFFRGVFEQFVQPRSNPTGIEILDFDRVCFVSNLGGSTDLGDPKNFTRQDIALVISRSSASIFGIRILFFPASIEQCCDDGLVQGVLCSKGFLFPLRSHHDDLNNRYRIFSNILTATPSINKTLVAAQATFEIEASTNFGYFASELTLYSQATPRYFKGRIDLSAIAKLSEEYRDVKSEISLTDSNHTILKYEKREEILSYIEGCLSIFDGVCINC